LKDYYELLEVSPTATPDDVKRAFRQQIARYHPDKVQHLGQEFQDMAAGRAAELTEAYRILSDQTRRAEYDRARMNGAAAPPPEAATAAAARTASAPAPEPSAASDPTHGSEPPRRVFTEERATRDEFVRKATLGRFVEALAHAAGDGYDRSPIRGFDVACVPKAKLFGRCKGPRLLGRFVACVDAATVAETMARAFQSGGSSEEMCVFLLGSGMAPRRELEVAIAQQRRRSGAAKVMLIPVDTRDWGAHVPVEAPPVVKKLLEHLRRAR